MFSLASIILGFVILATSARWFVNGAVALGKRFHLSELFIGIAIIAIGTSLPELAVNTTASAGGFGELAAANVLGSNIANILLIVGGAALIRPITATPKQFQAGLPLTILATLIIIVLAYGSSFASLTKGVLSRLDGLITILLFAAFAFFIFRKERLPPPPKPEWHAPVSRAIGAIGLGAIGLGVSANVIVNAAIALAGRFGVSQTLIGSTIIVFGTTLPELSAGIAAARRGSADLLIGNVVGSNIFNLFVVLGASALIAPIPFNGRAAINALIAGGAAALLWAALALHHRLRGILHPHVTMTRLHGAAFVTLYVAYLAFAAWQG